jgi:dTDP-4-dehydrorhamnose 3,5-epimerase
MLNYSVELTPIEGCFILNSPVHNDDRGFFREWFKNTDHFPFDCVQANFSLSHKDVLRGMHYSVGENSQAKVVTCVSGAFIDVLFDVRLDSPTYKAIYSIEASPSSGTSILVAPGVAHGFLALEEGTGVVYLTSKQYDPESDRSLNALDPHLAHIWPVSKVIRSKADQEAPYLELPPRD